MLRQITVLFALLGASSIAYADACPVGHADTAATTVVGQINGAPITLGEVDAHDAATLCKARVGFRQQLDELRQTALDDLIATRLLEAEAKRQKTSVDALLSKAASTVPAPDEAAMKAFYEQYKERIQEPYEAVKPKIAEVLGQQAQQVARATLLDGLKAAAKVSTDLPPLRIPVEATGFSKGPADAPITVVMFADYECPYCSRGAHSLEAAAAKYAGKIRMVYRDYPLPFHSNAVPAAVAARCAGAQQKFGAMHDELYAHQDALTGEALTSYAKKIGLDMKAFAACQSDAKHSAAIEADTAAGAAAGVDGTPAFFINGIKLGGAQPSEAFEAIFAQELARTKKR